MLKHLHIQNYALISHLDIDFESGFSVMTGETGAGKSIILGALALVLGARADSKAITDGEDKCIIEAEFDDRIIRRELYANGKSRSFVDDSVVTLQELKGLANKLIDIHSQHANLLIENTDFQLEVVDSIAENDAVRDEYTILYEAYTKAIDTLRSLEQQAQKAQDEADFIQYRFQMLDRAHLRAGELEELEQEQYRLSHAEDIRRALQTAVEAINGEQSSAIEALRSCHLEDAASDLQERIDSARIELRDIAQEAERMAERVEMDPQRLQAVEERIGELEDLMRTFKVREVDQLIEEHARLAQQLNRLDHFDEDIEQARAQLAQAKEVLEQKAKLLHTRRCAIIPSICRQLEEGLKRLGVQHAKVDVALTGLADFTPTGCDEVHFLFAANLNQSLRNVSEVASGGEMSRLMLCIKALLARTKGLPTIIFDEIDTGVSGDIASQMALIMQEMAQHRQVITITHLPQIAARGEKHYKVFKADTDTRTETHIRLLNNEERIREIASMLSGNNPSPEALANAKQLLTCK